MNRQTNIFSCTN